jgi:vitamin B12 transporter
MKKGMDGKMRGVSLALLAYIWAPAPAPAAELPPIVITAGRVAQPAEQLLAVTTVLDRRAIEQSQARTVPELLRGFNGVQFGSSGGRGQVNSLFLRGTESDHVLILIDGVRVGSAALGVTALEQIPLEQVERVELVRGPRSSLYGSEAIGGVLQVFTRRGGGSWRPRASLSAASHGTWEGAAGFGGGGDQGWYSVNLSGVDSDGFNACQGEPGRGGCFTHEPDRDGYRQWSGQARAGYRFGPGRELDLHWLRSEADTEFDGSFQNQSDLLQQVFGGSVSWRIDPAWDLLAQFGRSRDESDNFKDGRFSSRFETRRDSLSLQGNLRFASDHLLSLGLDYLDDRVDGSVAYPVQSRDNLGWFAQYLGQTGAMDWQASLRLDDNQQFGEHVTGGLGWGWRTPAGVRLGLTYGTAFKAPTFDELYFPGFGNSELDPEESETLELGLSGSSARLIWSLNLFETRIDRLIAFDALSYSPANIDAARIRGLELDLQGSWQGWQWRADMSLLDPRNRGDGANDGHLLPRRAQQTARLDVQKSFGDLALGATLNGVGRRYDDLANDHRLGGYATLDLRLEWALREDWQVQGRVSNLFDKDYQTAGYYNQPGRTFLLGLRYQP